MIKIGMIAIIVIISILIMEIYMTPKWKYDEEYRKLLIMDIIDYPLPRNSKNPKYHFYRACPDWISIYNIFIKMNATQSYFNEFVAYHSLWSIKDINNSDSSVLNDVEKFAYAASRQPKELLQMNNYEVEKSNNAIYDEIDWWNPDTSSVANNYGTFYDRNDNIRYKYWGAPPEEHRIITQYHNGYMYIFIDVGGG